MGFPLSHANMTQVRERIDGAQQTLTHRVQQLKQGSEPPRHSTSFKSKAFRITNGGQHPGFLKEMTPAMINQTETQVLKYCPLSDRFYPMVSWTCDLKGVDEVLWKTVSPWDRCTNQPPAA